MWKKKAWAAFSSNPKFVEVFRQFFEEPFKRITIESEEFKVIEKFVVTMYSKSMTATSINEARKALFFQRSQNVEHIPPSENSLYYHVLRAIHQSGKWAMALQAIVNFPSPDVYGWKKTEMETTDNDTVWSPLWMSQREAMQERRELFLSCTCNGVCTRCKCVKAALKCTAMCKCHCDERTPNE